MTILRRRRQRERQAGKGCNKQTNNSAPASSFAVIFLIWDAVLPLQLQLNFPSERVGIMAKEFERKRSQGFNDVFTASPFSDRKAPILDVRLIEVCFITDLTVLYIM